MRTEFPMKNPGKHTENSLAPQKLWASHCEIHCLLLDNDQSRLYGYLGYDSELIYGLFLTRLSNHKPRAEMDKLTWTWSLFRLYTTGRCFPPKFRMTSWLLSDIWHTDITYSLFNCIRHDGDATKASPCLTSFVDMFQWPLLFLVAITGWVQTNCHASG